MNTDRAQTTVKPERQIVASDITHAYHLLSEKLKELSDESREVPSWIKDGETLKVLAYIRKMNTLGGHMKDCSNITRSLI